MKEVFAKDYFEGKALKAQEHFNNLMMFAIKILIPILKDLPGDPNDFRVIKVSLKEVLVTDNTISFAHTETVNY